MITIVQIGSTELEILEMEKLAKEIPEITYIKYYKCNQEAFNFSTLNNPNLVFININLKDENEVINLVNELKNTEVSIVLLTDENNFSEKLIELNVFGYVIKPITFFTLKDLIEKYILAEEDIINIPSLKNEWLEYKNNKIIKRLLIYNLDKIITVNLNEIYYIQAEGNYTKFFLTDSRVLLSTESLKHYEELFPTNYILIRIHRSYMVNKNYVECVIKDKYKYFAYLKNKTSIEISRLKKDWFIKGLLY